MKLPISFGISSDALTADSADMAGHVACHRDLLQLWRRFGVLVHAEDDDGFARQIGELPLPVRKLWQEMLVTSPRRKNAACAHLKEPFHPRSAAHLRGTIELGLLTPASAAECGASGDRPSTHIADVNLEVCRFDLARHSEHFQWADRISSEGVVKGSDLQSIWTQRFEGFLSLSGHVVVVDRYCVADHLRTAESPSGLTRLLRAVARSPAVKSCQLYAAYTPELSKQTLANAVKSEWRAASSGQNTATVHLWTCDERKFGALVHHRWVRFDRVLVRLDKGLSDLSGRRAKRTSPLTISLLDQQTRNMEEELRRAGVSVTL